MKLSTSPMRTSPSLLATALLLAFPLLTGSGCASCGQSTVGALSGPVNDPANKTLRRQILSFGIGQFCSEMLKHDAPLQLAPDQPVIGRFYPHSCTTKELANGDLSVTFAGSGYAWTNLSKKLAFDMTGSVQYNQDFLMDGSTMYAYFRTRQVQSSDFKTRVIEQPVASFLNQLSPMGDNFGKQLVQSKLAEGFTVIRDSEGNADFSLGIVELGKKPVRPFDLHGTSRITYENARTEVHQNQRDFVGPIVVEDSGRALFVTGTMDGAPPIDVLFLRKDEAETSIGYYTTYAQIGPLGGQPFYGEVMQPGAPYSRTVPVPKGTYYVVFDNSSSAGQVAPIVNALDDRAAVVSYVVQVGDAP
ncbi:hypothetical protein BH09MYX1_BH09MYX1_35620 [soil metagenome]